MDKCHNWNTGTETIYVGQWPIFHGPVILPYIFKTIWWTNVIVRILDPCDIKINHIKCMWVSDLHFMVQWFWLISWRLFDGGMLDWRYWFSVTLSLTYEYYVGQWPIFCGTVILPYIFNTIWWTSLILSILVLIWTIDLYFMIKWFWFIYQILPIVVCWSLIWKYLWM